MSFEWLATSDFLLPKQLPCRAAMTWLNFISWYDDMSSHKVHFWNLNLSLHDNHKRLISIVCKYWVSYEYIHVTFHKEEYKSVGSNFLHFVTACSGKPQLSNFAQTHCLQIPIYTWLIISCSAYFMSLHNIWIYRGSPTTMLLSNIAPLHNHCYRMWGYSLTTCSSINLSRITSQEKEAVEVIIIKLSPKVYLSVLKC